VIYIIAILFAVTYFLERPIFGRKLSRKESAVLFVIYLCVGLTIRAVLYMFGM
jgi:Ca2+/Na+ antiporter